MNPFLEQQWRSVHTSLITYLSDSLPEQLSPDLVEIDLVRQGSSLFPAPVQNELRKAAACYGVCVLRAARPGEGEVSRKRIDDLQSSAGSAA